MRDYNMKIGYTPPEAVLKIKNINYLNVQRPKGYKVSFSGGRRQNAFLYTESGAMRYSFLEPQQRELSVNCGQLVYIPAATRYNSLYAEPDTAIKIVQFDISGTLPPGWEGPVFSEASAAEKIFSSMQNDLQSGAADTPFYFLSIIYELFSCMSQETQKLPVKYRKLQLALKEMHLYYADNHKILYYADLCGMSEPGFRRLFKEYTGLSPIDYRNRIRLQEARKLIGSGEFHVEEAALAVGFSNLSFFCRSYKKQFGISPGKDS